VRANQGRPRLTIDTGRLDVDEAVERIRARMSAVAASAEARDRRRGVPEAGVDAVPERMPRHHRRRHHQRRSPAADAVGVPPVRQRPGASQPRSTAVRVAVAPSRSRPSPGGSVFAVTRPGAGIGVAGEKESGLRADDERERQDRRVRPRTKKAADRRIGDLSVSAVAPRYFFTSAQSRLFMA
jgi:hypothetical protein